MRRIIGIGAAFAAAMTVTGPAIAAGFPEKDITFIIPYGPGGGFDTIVRKLSPVMQKYLPNKVNVVPKNIAGGGGKKALVTLYRAKPDGDQIAIFNMPGMLLDKILGQKTDYDIDKFTWIGRIAVDPYVLTASAKKGITSWKDLKGKSLKYAITNYNSGSYVAGRILSEAMGLKVAFLPGYKGSAAISLSMVRGDTDVSLFNAASGAKWAEGGDIKLILGLEDKSQWPNVPTVADAGHADLSILSVDRYVGAPPGLKPEVRKVISEALMKTLADKEIQAWSKKTGRPVHPLAGEAAEQQLQNLAKFYGKYKDALAKR
jgi:tripartite-type tricarboxylate transporter receptor subunit TctC